MRILPTSKCPKLILLGTLAILINGVAGAQTSDPEKTPKAGGPPARTQEAPAKPKEKMILFEMRDKPWKDVLEWLSDKTNMNVVTQEKPVGTLTFIAPKGGPNEFTVPQIVDILNESLLSQKLMLVRMGHSWTIAAADKEIDPHIVPRVRVEDLDRFGNTEMVSVVMPLKSLIAEDVKSEIEKLMGPFKLVVALAQANQLVLQDTAGNIRRVIKTIKEIDDGAEGNVENFSHRCEYIKAREAERVLRDLLGDPREMIRLTMPRGDFGGRGGMPGADGGMQQFQMGSFPGGFQGGMATGDGRRGGRDQAPTPRLRMHYISGDERTNTVLVTGPANVIAKARDIMKKLDVPQPNQQKVMVGPPEVRTYAVPAGNAEAVAKTLQEIYRASTSNIRISAISASQIMVYATPEDQFEIAKHILGTADKSTTSKLLTLNTLEASRVVDTLKGMFGDSKTSTSAPYMEADLARNSIVVKGTPEQITQVEEVLKVLGEGAIQSGNFRIIGIDRGNAATLAEELKRLLSGMRENPIKINVPGGNPAVPEKAPEKMRAPERNSRGEEQDEPPAKPKTQLVDPQAPQQPKPGKKDVPVNITAVGNKLLVTSDDPEALALVQELVRLLTQKQEGDGDFHIIRLKFASATDTAKLLDELFNGVRQNQQQQQQNPFNPFARFQGMMAQAQQAQAAAPRIRVVADPATNSILVRANPIDMLEIRRLIRDAIDTGETDSKAVIQTFIIPMKYASANEVASIIRDVYREYMNTNPQTGTFGGFGGFGFFRGGQNRNVDANGNPRQVTLSVGVDDHSNRLILSCNEKLYDDIKKLTDQLDNAAKDSAKTVRFVPIKGIDPALVQQAIDAIQGRRTSSTTPTGTGGFGGFPGRFGGGNFGGGNFGGGRGPGMGGFGGPGMGGGGMPGGGGGGAPARPPGSGMAPPGGGSGGSGFFAERVKDDPEPTLLYDPQRDDTRQLSNDSHLAAVSPQAGLPGETRQSAGEEEQQQPAQKPDPKANQKPDQKPDAKAPAGTSPDQLRGPRSNVTADALPELGGVLVTGGNPADVEEVIRIIEALQKLGSGGEVQIKLHPLDFADPTALANTLSQLYQRVTVGTGANVIVGARTTTPTATPFAQPGTAATTGAQGGGNVVLIPYPRLSAILVATTKARFEDVIKQIQELDKPTAAQAQPVAFALKKAGAARVGALVQNFYLQRYPNETSAQNQIRVTWDDTTNTVFVQAARGDLEEIRALIERIDNTVSSAVNELRIIPLRNAVSDDLANLILQSILQGVTTPAATTPGIVPTVPGQAGAGAALRAATPGLFPGATPTAATTGAGLSTTATKSTTLRFISSRLKAEVESGLLDDIKLTSDPRTNSLIISAPARTMELIGALILELDVPASARATIKVFNLKKADAVQMAITLQQLFLGTSTGATATTLPGGGGGGAFGGAGGANLATFGGQTGFPRAIFNISGVPSEGAPLVPLSLAVDSRTNSLIVGGNPNDIEVVEAIVYRLEDADIQNRNNHVYCLKNSSAVDVANSLQTFIQNTITIYRTVNQLTAFQEIERDIVIVPDPISNKLLISATPRYFAELIRLIDEIDQAPPQVVIQVLIAEVDLNNTEEFGIELGLQSPVLFSRSVIPQTNAFGAAGSVTYNNAAGTVVGSPVPPSVTVNTSMNPAALPGFAFNSTGPLGNNPLANPGLVGYQGIGNLGVGRSSQLPGATGLGGLVFSAASDTVSILIRSLKTQSRLDILSRPQVMATNNQTAQISVGQNVPYLGSSTITATGFSQQNVERANIGVNLTVQPQINNDGTVLLRVQPDISSLGSLIPLGNGQNGQIFNQQFVATTVLAADGQTVAIGGLINKRDEKHENKVPILGDIPYLGAAFRFRTQAKMKTELLVILTPHIVRTKADAERILAEEAKRVDWILGDVTRMHGTSGMEPILATQTPPGAGCRGDATLPPLVAPHQGGDPLFGLPPGVPAGPMTAPATSEPAKRETLPQPRTISPPTSKAAPANPVRITDVSAPPGTPPVPTTMPQSASPGPALNPPGSTSREKETQGWNVFRRDP